MLQERLELPSIRENLIGNSCWKIYVYVIVLLKGKFIIKSASIWRELLSFLAMMKKKGRVFDFNIDVAGGVSNGGDGEKRAGRTMNRKLLTVKENAYNLPIWSKTD